MVANRPFTLSAVIGLSLLFASSLVWASPECQQLQAIYGEYATEIERPDSTPARLEGLVARIVDAIEACRASGPTESSEIQLALKALQNPIVYVSAGDVSSDWLRQEGNEQVFSIDAQVVLPGESGKIEKTLGSFRIACGLLDGDCYPVEKPQPHINISNLVQLRDGRHAKVKIRESGKDLSLTWVALKALHDEAFEASQKQLTRTQGTLAKANHDNFVRAFIKLHCQDGMRREQAAEQAIKDISFGTHRMSAPFFYRKFDVSAGFKAKQVALPNGQTVNCEVPVGKVKVTAHDRDFSKAIR